MADESLTPEEITEIIDRCEHKAFPMRQMVREGARVQLAKAKPIIYQEGFDEGVKKTTDAMDSTFSAQLEEAKKRERESIVAWGLEMCPHWSDERTKEVGVMKRDCSLCWQALKEGK